ncbi:membrane protein [Asticcacaulis sp. DW145]|jgi:hypothetical protein|uniref:DUF2178 domain-containing protein n=1 Tax=Asticcacaulis currens TaxID=2984210 RepID=A0ABT5IHT4_9CAUL|nr:hypothetical protein [Asticcacaulis currens]MDC7695517.1 hypothetical protein [Asticcacaulis currens]BEV10823.1 membrane protein [Asticcacaulis sp. DW145]
MTLKNPATEYTIHMMVWMALYAGLLIGAILYIKANHPTGPLLYGLAVLPALPIGGTIFTALRFLDRVDEYFRLLLSKRFIVATGLTLFICTAIGFVENFAELEIMPLYLVYALFWACYGVTCAFIRTVK